MSANILIAGDFFLEPDFLTRHKTANILSRDLQKFILRHDYRLVNFEGAIGSHFEAVPKSGPNLCAPEESVSVLKSIGFHAATLANNHAMDFGEQGLSQTISTLKSHDLSIVGGGRDVKAAMTPLTFTLSNQKIAVLNYCQHEWGVSSHERAGVAGLDIQHTLAEVRQLKSDGYVTIVITHMGHEHFREQTPAPQRIMELYAQCGADAIINHHPHVTGGKANIQEAVVFSSIGNFLFSPQIAKQSEVGALASLEVDNGKVVRAEMEPIAWDCEKRILKLLQGPDRMRWDKETCDLSSKLTSEHELENSLTTLCALRKREYLSRIEPIDNKILRGLKRLGVFRGLWSQRRKRALLNIIRCEAHREALIRILEDELKGSRR